MLSKILIVIRAAFMTAIITGAIVLLIMLIAPYILNESSGTYPQFFTPVYQDTYQHVIYDTSTTTPIVTTHTFPFQGKTLSVNIVTTREIYTGATNPKSHEMCVYSDIPDTTLSENVYLAHINDPTQKPIIEDLVKQFNNLKTQYNLDDDEYVEMVTSYVQSIPYYTEGDCVKFPVQTLWEHRGDCDDKSIILSSLLAESGYDAALIEFDDDEHMTSGVRAGLRYAYPNADGYALIETTDYYFVTAKTQNEHTATNVIVVGNGTKTYNSGYAVEFILDYLDLAEKELDMYDNAWNRIRASYHGTDTYNRAVDAYNKAVNYYNLFTSKTAATDRKHLYESALIYRQHYLYAQRSVSGVL